MPATLPAARGDYLRMKDARKHTDDYFASLEPLEYEILDTVFRGGMVFGHQPGRRDPDEESRGRIVLAFPGKRVGRRTVRQEDRVISGGQRVLDRLTRAGWLRFAGAPAMKEASGYFWLTDDAKRLFELPDRNRGSDKDELPF